MPKVAAVATPLAANDVMTCVLRLPLPDKASAAVVTAVIESDPSIEGVSKRVVRQADTAKESSTVEVTLEGSNVRAMRAAIGAVLDHAKLSVRTVRLYPPTGAFNDG